MKLVIQNSSKSWGGQQKSLATIARGLLDRSHGVVVACHPDGEFAEEMARREIPTAAAPLGGDLNFHRVFNFMRLLQAEQPDALLLTNWGPNFWGGWVGQRSGARVVLLLGIVRPFPSSWKHTTAIRQFIDAIVVNSCDIRKGWLNSGAAIPPEKMPVIFNGIQVPEVSSSPIRRELDIPEGTPLAVAVGRLTAQKGFDLLLQSLKYAPTAHLAVVGSGPDEDALHMLALSLGVADRVHWLGFRWDVPEVVAGCDAFVLSSRWEGMAHVMLEAMSLGVPVLATDVSGVREALGPTDGRSPAGWIVPPENPEALGRGLAALVEELRSAPEQVRQRTREARARVDDWFTVDRMLDQLEQVLWGRVQ